MKAYLVVTTENVVASSLRVTIHVVSVGFEWMRLARESETVRGSAAKTAPRKPHAAARRTV